MKKRSYLLGMLLLLGTLAPTTLVAQHLSTVTGITLGPMSNREAGIQGQLPVGDGGYALGAGLAFAEQAYGEVHWSTIPEKLPAERIRVTTGSLSLQAPLFGLIPSTTTITAGVSSLDWNQPEWEDPFGSVSLQIMLPLSARIVLVPVAVYTFGEPYPVGTLIAQWQINDRYTLQATVLSPAVTLSYTPTESVTLSSGVMYGSDGYSFSEEEVFSYSRLRFKNEVALTPKEGITLAVFGEALLLQEFEYTTSEDDLRDSEDGVDASLGARLQLAI